MANPNAILSMRVRLDVPGERPAAEMLRADQRLSVELDGGRRVGLDPGNPRSPGFALVLARLAEMGHPVYLEIDPESEAVALILVPSVGRIEAMREVEAGIEVMLDSSHARNLLSRDRPDFEALAAPLREASGGRAILVVTADEAQRIVDVRIVGPDDLLPPGFDRRPAIRPGLADRITEFLRWPWWPWRWWHWRCISPGYAQQVFDAMSAETCSTAAIAPPCIPFLFPDDGCWGRAHQMRRLMNQMGLWPRKVWIDGWLHTPTRNNPNCFVEWGWHVAPTLCVRRRRRWWLWWWPWSGQRMVIDPSLFTTPVTLAQWKAVQGDPNATLTHTPGSTFWARPNNAYPVTDPTYFYTDQVLATYRTKLQNRVNLDGGPPYAHCP